MKRFYTILILLFSLFATQTFFGKDLFKGKVEAIDKTDNGIWIKSNQALILKVNDVLYIHDANDNAKAIVKVDQIKPRFIKAKVIDGNFSDIKEGEKVNNILKWDGYKYKVEIVYEKETRKIKVQDEMVIDNRVSVTSLFGSKKEDIDGREIQSLQVKGDSTELVIKEIILKDGRSIKSEKTTIDSIRKFINKKVDFDIPGVGPVTFTSSDISSINIQNKIEGAKKITNLHYSLGESAFPQAEGEKYTVTFKFLNYELGLEAIENKISKENDSEKIKSLIQNLKLYDESSISSVGVAGSFNGWDDTKTPMEKNKQNMYEAKITLAKGSHEYYFVIYYNGADKEKMTLKVLDPYSNRIQNIGSSTSTGNDKTKKDDDDDDDDESSTSESGKEGTSASSEGVDGKVSVIEVPGLFVSKAETKASDVPEATKGDLPYNPEDLKVEEANIDSKIIVSDSIIVGNVRYYKVTIKFDRIKKVRTELKRAINREASKGYPDPEKVKKYKDILASFNELKVSQVSITGSFNNWKAGEYNLAKGSNDVWEGIVYLPEGKHQYKFAIDSGGSEPYLMVDGTAKDKETDPSGEVVSVLYIGVTPTEKPSADTEKTSDKKETSEKKETVETEKPAVINESKDKTDKNKDKDDDDDETAEDAIK